MFLKEQIAYQLDLILCESSSKFDFRHFKTLSPLEAQSIEYDHFNRDDDDIEESTGMLDYAKEHLRLLGEGSSRAVFYLSNRFVLKIAKNDAGYAQNEAEVEVFTNPATKPIVAKIYDFDPDYAWIVSEVVRELTTAREFEEKSGFQLLSLMNILRADKQTLPYLLKEPDYSKLAPHHHDMAVERYKMNNKVFASPLYAAIKELQLNSKIQLVDLQTAGHWGMTADGQLVILDYGFTRDVSNAFY